MKNRLVFVFLWAVGVYAETPQLDDMNLEQLMTIEIPTVVGASKHEQKITDAPSDVSIMTADDIKKFGYRTLADLMNGVRGFYTTYDGAYNFLGSRGVGRPGDYGGRFLLNVNGHRMNEPIYDSLLIQYDFPLDLDLIERVEIIRGPGSVLYGNNAFFGVINVVTRDAVRFSAHGGEVAGIYGFQDFKQGRITQALNWDSGFNLLLSGTYYDSRGARVIDYPNYPSDAPVAPVSNVPGKYPVFEHDSMGAFNVFGKANYQDFTFEALYGKRLKEFPSAPYGTTLGDKNTTGADTRAYAELRFEHTYKNGLHTLVRGYGDYYAYDGLQAFYKDKTSTIVTVNADEPRAFWWGLEGQASQTFFSTNRVTIGAEFRQDPIRRLHNFDYTPLPAPKPYINLNAPMFSFGAYLQDEWAILTNLNLNAGLRYDYFSTSGNALNPRAAVVYHPWESSTLKLLFGRAYRIPNAFEFNYQAAGYVANPGLKPETIYSYELMWEQELARFYRANLGVFFNDISDLITQVDTDAGDSTFRNVGTVKVLGGFTGLETNWGNGWRGRINYTYSYAVDTTITPSTTLSNSPQHLGKLQLIAPLYDQKVFASIELLALSDRQTVKGDTLPGYFTGNLTLFSTNLVENLEVSLSVYNFWGQRHSDPGAPDFALDSIPQSGIAARGKLLYRF